MTQILKKEQKTTSSTVELLIFISTYAEIFKKLLLSS